MDSNKIITKMKDTKVLLSTLWIFATFNYLYCDVLTIMDSRVLKQIITGTIGGIKMTQGFLMGAAILIEIPIAMVLLSRILKYRANRRANIMAGVVMTAAQISSLFFGSSPASYYVFFSVIEIASTLSIVWFAWKWSTLESRSQQ